jgi:pyrroloquinoline quinone biosynthesis protein B
LPLYCTASVWRELNGALPLVPVLSHYCGVRWHELTVDGGVQVPGVDGIRFTPLALSSKAPPYSDHRAHPQTGDNIGLLIEDVATGASAFYAPGLGAIDPQVEAALRRAGCVLVDGTFWRADEMIALGLSSKTAADMGHLPQSGDGGMIAVLDGIDARRKVLIHINNTNPILDEDSEQRALLARHGIEVAFDGMEITL